VTGTGQAPATADEGTTPVAPGDTGGSVNAGRPAGGSSGATKPASQAVRGSAASASCAVKSTRRGSTVTCKMTVSSHTALALRARLTRGKTLLASTRTTARAGHARVTLRTARRLRVGRYTVTVARRDGTRVLLRQLRVA
jgi:hypothetical protein